MRPGWIVLLLVSVGIALTAYSQIRGPHDFAESDCNKCHWDVEKKAGDLKPVLSSICAGCHAEARQKLSHPVDVKPETVMPADMPLVDGKLSCLTCHYVHPFSIKYKPFSYFLLRRPGRGAAFCIACHGIDEKGHIIYENVHQGSYKVTDRSTSLDAYTLQCIECHDKRINNPGDSLGAGSWQHFGASGLNHPVGVSLDRIAGRKPREYNPEVALLQEIRLFDGKLGCGTCHNAYSKEKNLLVVNNYKSRLCLACHIK